MEQIGKAKLLNLTGGIAANGVFYDGTANRDPFTYFVNGNLNLNISGVYNIPFSFSYTNQKFNTSNPFSFNRLSIHPSYKWITTHIGDVNMTFSPYTLNGHQFTGVGVDLAPPNTNLKVSAMYGRLLKESEHDTIAVNSEPAYKRMGYGLKAVYANEKFSVSGTVFSAKDDEGSINQPVPIEFELQAKENVVASAEGSVKLFDRGEIRVEYATSLITEDISAEGINQKAVFSNLIATNATTRQYRAYNANFNYQVGQGTVGAGYEYIDPDYRTFGAYFFNNDLENFTVNASQTIFNNKVNISVNAGLQRDDLDNTKSSQLQRVVSAVNVNYAASDKITFTGGYSNFQSYTNIKSQFDFINEVSQSDNIDTLDFQQITQSANLNANFILKDAETKKRNLNIAVSYQGATNKQGGEVAENGSSNFYNGSSTYTLGYPNINLNVSGSVNVTYNTIGTEENITFGPIVSANKLFFDKKLRTSASVSYNQTNIAGEKQGDVTNIRLGGNYIYKKKHGLNLTLLTQFRNSENSSNQDFTATIGYNYTFDKIKPPRIQFNKREKTKKERTKKSRDKRKRSKKEEEALLNFRYRDSSYQGTMAEVDVQLEAMQNHSYFDHIPAYKKGELTMLRSIASDQRNTEDYKENALIFLKELYSYEDFLKNYNQMVFEILTELRRDMNRLDYAFEKAFVKAKVTVDNHQLHQLSDEEKQTKGRELQKQYVTLIEAREKALARLIGHRWMLPIISSYNTLVKVEKPDKLLATLMEKEKDNIFRLKDKGESEQKIELYLITRIIDFYLKESLKHTSPDKFELKYIDKN
ncbi:hypothetical protein [Aquimarina brevivitae]|uniref:hypothetical protein n=1 Tax=Aquimarina brevivitae TaxID=323412 RepID=UPI00102A19A8|nr:hypothetical protein [Aquimarina brevivitae]